MIQSNITPLKLTPPRIALLHALLSDPVLRLVLIILLPLPLS